MTLNARQVQIVVEQFVLLDRNGSLYVTNGFILLLQQIRQLFLLLALIPIHDLPQLCKVFLHLGLNDLPISLLNSLEVLLRLLQLRCAIEYQVLGRLDLVLDVVHYLRDDVDVAQAQILFINALRTQ